MSQIEKYTVKSTTRFYCRQGRRGLVRKTDTEFTIGGTLTMDDITKVIQDSKEILSTVIEGGVGRVRSVRVQPPSDGGDGQDAQESDDDLPDLIDEDGTIVDDSQDGDWVPLGVAGGNDLGHMMMNTLQQLVNRSEQPQQVPVVAEPVQEEVKMQWFGNLDLQNYDRASATAKTQLRGDILNIYQQFGVFSFQSFTAVPRRRGYRQRAPSVYRMAFPHLRDGIADVGLGDHDFPVCSCPSYLNGNYRWPNQYNRVGGCKHVHKVMDIMGLNFTSLAWDLKDNRVHENIRQLTSGF